MKIVDGSNSNPFVCSIGNLLNMNVSCDACLCIRSLNRIGDCTEGCLYLQFQIAAENSIQKSFPLRDIYKSFNLFFFLKKTQNELH